MPAAPSPEPTLQDLLAALDRLAESGFHEVELRVGRARLRVSRGPQVAPAVVAAAPAPPASPASAPSETPVSAGASERVEDGLETVASPMVGTFYRRPRPDAEAFVEVGDRVKKGQVLCIIEAMKLMNNIEAETAGEVVSILAEDASAVQFGDPLFLVRPA